MKRAIKSATKAEQAYQAEAREFGCVELRALLAYDEHTGVFTWRKSTGRCPAGKVAGSSRACGYRLIAIRRRHYYAHRLAWLHFYGEWPDGNIDHIDGNPANNRIANLRACSQSENMQNQHRVRKDNKVGLTGVSWDKSRGLWQAAIQAHGARYPLGRFSSADEAHAAYLKAKDELHPFRPRAEGAQ